MKNLNSKLFKDALNSDAMSKIKGGKEYWTYESTKEGAYSAGDERAITHWTTSSITAVDATWHDCKG